MASLKFGNSPESGKCCRNLHFFFFARFGQFLYCSDRVQVAQVLEMQTRQCRVLRTETYRQPTRPLVQVGIGLTSGSLAGLSGSSQVQIALVVVVINGGFWALSFFSTLLLLTKHSFYPFSLLFFTLFLHPLQNHPNQIYPLNQIKTLKS